MAVIKIAPKREGQKWEEIEKLEKKIADILSDMEACNKNIAKLQQMLEEAEHKFYNLRWELVEAIEEYQAAISPWRPRKEGA